MSLVDIFTTLWEPINILQIASYSWYYTHNKHDITPQQVLCNVHQYERFQTLVSNKLAK